MSEKRDHAAPLIAVPFPGAAGPGKRPPTPQRAAGDPVSDRLNALSERLNAPPGAFTPPKAILLIRNRFSCGTGTRPLEPV